jgi:hypothetical protein
VSRSAEIVAWLCFVVGVLVLFAGVAIGLYLTFGEPTHDVKRKIAEGKDKVDELTTAMTSTMRAGAGQETAAAAAQSQASEVKSKFEEIGELVGSLPENLRFAGLLVLVGTVLMGVATVEFGGQQLF